MTRERMARRMKAIDWIKWQICLPEVSFLSVNFLRDAHDFL